MTQPPVLRWGVLGAARVVEKLIPALLAAENAQLVAIASRRKGAAAEVIEKFAADQAGVEAMTDLEGLLQRDDIDAVYLPMANEEHAEWALRAIAAGKHVLIEKPMALRAEEIDAISVAAAQQGVVVMEGFMYRFHPQHRVVQEIIESGVIGEVRVVNTHFAFPMTSGRLYRINRTIDDGGGAMWDIGPYAVHTARLWFDDEPVKAFAMAKLNDQMADVSLAGQFAYSNGRFAQFEISFEHARRSVYEIIGTQGGIRCHQVWQPADESPVISWWTDAGQQERVELPAADQFVLEIEHFSECALHGKTPLLTLADARANCRAIEAALQSVREGRAIDL